MPPFNRTIVVDQKHPCACDSGEGSAASPFATISRAALLAQPGDTVLVRSGVYRERVAPARGGTQSAPITYLAPPGEEVRIRGSDVFSPNWEAIAPHVVKALLVGFSTIDAFNPFAVRLRGFQSKKTLGQVFVNDEMLYEMESLDQVIARPGSWTSLDSGREIAIHFPHHGPAPAESCVELSVRNRIFAPFIRGLGHIHVRGFIFERCANQSAGSFWEPQGTQGGAVSCRSGHHWIIENNSIRFAKSIGIDCGSEGGADRDGPEIPHEAVGYHLIHNNVVSDNGETGITGSWHYGTQIIGNVIERNNALGCAAVEEAGIKFHHFFNGLIEGNLIRDNDCRGVWLDNVWYGSRVTRNIVLNSTEAGIFVELGTGDCLVDTNFVGFTRCGDGIYTHDTSGITVAHNMLYCNTHFGVYMRTVSERAFVQPGVADRVMPATSHMRVYNNVFVDNYRGQICLPLETERDFDNLSDYNLFVCGAQWQWEGLGFNRFCLGCDDGRISPERIAAALQAALRRHGASGVRPSAEIDPHDPPPNISLEEWRLVTGNDLHSVAPLVHRGEVENGAIQKGSSIASPTGLFVEFRNRATFTQLRCPKVPRVTHDLYGRELPGHAVLPGPFGELDAATVAYPLWPLPKRQS